MATAAAETETVTMWPEDLTTRPPFSDLFPIAPATRAKIVVSMREYGFDASKPIDVWRQENVVVDGHTRLAAAKELKIDVHVYFHDFADEDAAFEYAVKTQCNRRNLTNQEIAGVLEKMIARKVPYGGDRRSPDFIASREAMKQLNTDRELAEITGISRSTVQRTCRVLREARPEEKQAVLDGKASINSTYNAIQVRKRRTNGKVGKPLSVTPPTTPVRSEPLPDVQHSPEDEAWLATLPLRRRIAPKHRFDDDALIYRAFADEWKTFRERLDQLLGGRSTDCRSHLHARLSALADAASIKDWTPCPKCEGSGVGDRGYCRGCRGCGYVIPGL